MRPRAGPGLRGGSTSYVLCLTGLSCLTLDLALTFTPGWRMEGHPARTPVGTEAAPAGGPGRAWGRSSPWPQASDV